jgi:hypothetical protein
MDGEVAGNPPLHGSSLHSEEIYHQKTRGLGHGKAAYPRNKKGEFTMPNKVLSTGVLIRDPASFNANVTVVNAGATTGQTAQVEIFDWGGAALEQAYTSARQPFRCRRYRRSHPTGFHRPHYPIHRAADIESGALRNPDRTPRQ